MIRWMKRISLYTGGLLCALAALLFLFLFWLFASRSGAEWSLAQAVKFAPIELTYSNLKGTLWGGLQFEKLLLRGSAAESPIPSIKLQQFSFSWQPLTLLEGRLQITQLTIANGTVSLPPKTQQTTDEAFELPQFWLPLAVEAKVISVSELRIVDGNNDTPLPAISASVWLAGNQLHVPRLELDYDNQHYSMSARGKFAKRLEFSAKLKSHGVNFTGNCENSDQLQCRGEVLWKNFSHPLTADMQSPNGKIKWGFQQQRLRIEGDADFIWPLAEAPFDTRVSLEAEADFNAMSARVEFLKGEFASGGVVLSGDLQWQDKFSMQARLDADQISLAHWLPEAMSESLASGQGVVELALTASGYDLNVDFSALKFEFGGKPLLGQTQIHLNEQRINVTQLKLTGAGSQLDAKLQLAFDSGELRLDGKLDSQSLTAVVPEISGQLQSVLKISGRMQAPVLDLSLNANNLNGFGFGSEELQLALSVAAREPLAANASLVKTIKNTEVRKLQLMAKTVTQAQQAIGDITVDFSGHAASHQLSLKLKNIYQQFDVDTFAVSGQLALPDDNASLADLQKNLLWQGSVSKASFISSLDPQFGSQTLKPAAANTEVAAHRWVLTQMAPVSIAANKLSLQNFCVQRAGAVACIDAANLVDGVLFDVSANLEGLALAKDKSPFPQWYDEVPEGWLFEGDVRAKIKATGRFNVIAQQLDQFDLTARSWIADGRLHYIVENEPELDLPLDNVSIDITGDSNKLTVSGRLEVDSDRQMLVSGFVNQWQGAQRALELSINGELADLNYLQAFLPQVRNITGSAAIAVTVVQLPAQPTPSIKGQIRFSNVSLLVPASGAKFANWNLLVDASGQEIVVKGKGNVGAGEANVDGKVKAQLLDGKPSVSARLAIDGKNLTLVDLPDIKLNASSAMKLAGADKTWHLSGEVAVHDSLLRLRELPVTAVNLSEDAQIYGTDQAQEKSFLQFTSNLRLLLGRDVRFEGFGLTTSVEGSLLVTRDADHVNQAQGVLTLPSGRYRSYGQKLDIENGRIIFAGPIDNPNLDVRAARKIDTVTAGIWLKGTAKHPKTELYSEPSMSEADVLAYMMTGKPISQAGEGDSTQMESAAISMGLKQALPMLQRIGGEFGISDISVEEGSSGGSSIAAGRRVNDKLYVKYVYGLLGAVGNFVLQYSLTEQMKIEATSGASQAVDLTYTWSSKPPTQAEAKASAPAAQTPPQ